jgi:hypothetical protein
LTLKYAGQIPQDQATGISNPGPIEVVCPRCAHAEMYSDAELVPEPGPEPPENMRSQ